MEEGLWRFAVVVQCFSITLCPNQLPCFSLSLFCMRMWWMNTSDWITWGCHGSHIKSIWSGRFDWSNARPWLQICLTCTGHTVKSKPGQRLDVYFLALHSIHLYGPYYSMVLFTYIIPKHPFHVIFYVLLTVSSTPRSKYNPSATITHITPFPQCSMAPILRVFLLLIHVVTSPHSNCY